MNRKTIISFLLIIIWMIFIFFMSNMPSKESDNESKTLIIYIIEKYDILVNSNSSTIKRHHSDEFITIANGIFRKCAHAFVYFVLSILIFNFLHKLNKFGIYKNFIIDIITCIIYACTDEYHQTFVVGRSGELRDILIDSFGAILGLVIIIVITKLISIYSNCHKL